MTFLTSMAGIVWVNDIYDFIVFSRKHNETQSEIKNLKAEISLLNRTLYYMTREIRENNKLIKNVNDNVKIKN